MNERILTPTQLDEWKSLLLQEERSGATVEKYLRDVRAFMEYADGRPLTKELTIEYKRHLLECYAPTSVNSILAAVNGFLKAQGWYDCVVRSVKVQRQSFRDRERELTKEEYYRLLAAAKRKGNERLYWVMQTICATGIRVSELRFITVEAVKCGRAMVNLKGKMRQVLLPKALVRELKHYAKVRGIHSGSLFVTRGGKPLDRSNILHEMKALCTLAGVDSSKVFPHNLRHLFACLFYQATKDISRLADILGHFSINTTRIYTCVSGAEQQRQIERLGLVLSTE